MTPAARLASAIEVFHDLDTRRRPAADALKDWGLAHRFAGSKDRAAIASLVYDALRRKASSQFIMRAEGARPALIGMLKLLRGLSTDEIAALCSGERHAPPVLSEAERAALEAADLSGAAPAVAADCQEWLLPELEAVFGDALVGELQALATRAPTDIRANTLKNERAMLYPHLAHFHPVETPHSPVGLRFSADGEGRGPALQATPEFIKGAFEIQDEGSQLVALLAAPSPGDQIIDLCAGGGGKTLELSALLNNSGQIYATDNDARRLAPIHDRLARAGVRNVQVMTPKGRDDEPLRGLDAKADLVLVDAPCTGTGTWRRNPDIKWRIRPGALTERIKEQDAVLSRAARFVRPGGRLAYITCSVLEGENDARIAAFLAAHPAFEALDPRDTLTLAPDSLSGRADLVSKRGLGLQLSPLRTQTDGFYLSLLRRNR